MKNFLIGIVATFLLIAVVGLPIFFQATPVGKAMWNNYQFGVQKADDATNYNTRKTVEDTCRAMVSSYEADKLTYNQYKSATDPEKQSWGEEAKMRANKTATSYNEYILKNSFVWQNNIPDDILKKLDTIS